MQRIFIVSSLIILAFQIGWSDGDLQCDFGSNAFALRGPRSEFTFQDGTPSFSFQFIRRNSAWDSSFYVDAIFESLSEVDKDKNDIQFYTLPSSYKIQCSSWNISSSRNGTSSNETEQFYSITFYGAFGNGSFLEVNNTLSIKPRIWAFSGISSNISDGSLVVHMRLGHWVNSTVDSRLKASLIVKTGASLLNLHSPTYFDDGNLKEGRVTGPQADVVLRTADSILIEDSNSNSTYPGQIDLDVSKVSLSPPTGRVEFFLQNFCAENCTAIYELSISLEPPGVGFMEWLAIIIGVTVGICICCCFGGLIFYIWKKYPYLHTADPPLQSKESGNTPPPNLTQDASQTSGINMTRYSISSKKSLLEKETPSS